MNDYLEANSAFSMESREDRERLRKYIMSELTSLAPELKETEIRQRYRRRAMHFVPANNPEFIAKSRSLGADTIIADLEDSVPKDEKEQARQNIAGLTRDSFRDSELCIRINGSSSEFIEQDLDVCREIQPDSIMLPKIKHASEIEKINQASEGIEVIPIIETVEALREAEDIIKADSVHTVCFGAEDFYAALSVRYRMRKGDIVNNQFDRERYMRFVQPLIMLCSQNDVQFIDSVHTLFQDSGGGYTEAQEHLRKECQFMRQEGALGKFSIHPSQIETICQEFDLSAEEIIQAIEKLKTFQQTAVIVDNEGRMQDTPETTAAKKIIVDALRYL